MKQKKNKLKSIDAPFYSYWSALYKSFYSRYLYIDVGKRWRGFALLYLLLAIAVFSIPFVIRMDLSFNQSFQQQIIKPLQEIPVFYIQAGNVIFDKPMPYMVKDDKGQVVVIVDTTGKVNDFSKYPSLTVLVNKNKISLKIPRLQLFNMAKSQLDNAPPMVQEFDKDTNLMFDGKMIVQEKTITNLKYFAQGLMYPMIVAMLYSICISFFLVFGFLGQIFSNVFFSFKVSFKQSCRLLIVSGTPMLLLMVLLLTFNNMFLGSGFILLILLIAYFSFALYSLRADSKKIVRQG